MKKIRAVYIMDARKFSQEIRGWLNPEQLLNAVTRYNNDNKGAVAQMSIFFTSPYLSSTEEGSLLKLIIDFLQNFKVDPDLIELLRALTTTNLDESSWEWLGSLKFEGNMFLVNKGNPNFPKDTIFVVQERDAVADILMQPIQLLINAVSTFSEHWKPMANVREQYEVPTSNFYLIPSSPEPLAVYIEAQVAEGYGFTNNLIEAGIEETGRWFVYNGYRAITIIGKPPFEEALCEVAKKAAYSQAASTMEKKVNL